MEVLLTQMVVPYMQAINLILLISNTVLLTCGLYSLWCNITYIVIQTVTALQVVAIGCFVILQQPIRVEVSDCYWLFCHPTTANQGGGEHVFYITPHS